MVMKNVVKSIADKVSNFKPIKFSNFITVIDKKTIANPPEKIASKQIKDIEKELSFPIVIVGTRKPFQKWFWAWDVTTSLIVRQKLNPYLYLTFQDKQGTIVGPIRYHSELIGWGAKLEFAIRCQMGRLHGFEKADLYEIPKKIEVEGGEGSFGIGIGNSYTRLKMPGIGCDVLLQYFGACAIGGIGYVKIKKGTFEIEESTCQYGLQPWIERYAKIFVGLVFFLSCIPYVAQTMALFGVFG